MNRPDYKTEGVNRTKTVRVYPFVFTVEVPCKEVRTPLTSITFSEERDVEASYGYCNEYQPHAVKRMFDYKNGMLYDMRWDEAGNLGQVSMGKPGEMFEAGRFLFWTEDCCGPRPCGANRMHAAVDDRYYSYYAYDHGGERRLKLTGDNKLLDVNANFMATYTILNEQTLYPSAYMVLTNRGYTKHYYAGAERVAARLGGGGLNAMGNAIGYSDTLLARADTLFGQSLEQVNSRALNGNDIDCILGNGFAKEEFGHPIDGIPCQMQAGVDFFHDPFKDMVHSMQFDCNNGQEREVYFYHSDHLGSASWITDSGGQAIQHLQYLPYGEPYINQRTSGYNERYTFTGKERDEETGYGYFGARYMDHELMTMWLSVDPMADKYPSISPYAYCAGNPLRLVDPDGRMIDDYKIFRDGTITIAKTNDPYDRFFVEQSDGTFGVVEMKKHLVGAGRNAGKEIVEFPSHGLGFTRYGNKDPNGDHYVLPLVAAALLGAINQIIETDPSVTVAFGDMSDENGLSPSGKHSSHNEGRNVDVRLIRKDRNHNMGTDVHHAQFDKEANQILVDAFKFFGFKDIKNNSTELTGVSFYPGHDNHLHLQGFAIY